MSDEKEIREQMRYYYTNREIFLNGNKYQYVTDISFDIEKGKRANIKVNSIKYFKKCPYCDEYTAEIIEEFLICKNCLGEGI